MCITEIDGSIRMNIKIHTFQTKFNVKDEEKNHNFHN